MPDFNVKNDNELKCPIEDRKNVFIIDGQIPNQVARYAEISQIIDDTAIVKCIPGGGIAIRKLADLFPSRHEAETAIKTRMELHRQEYASQIKDIDSLVRFMLTHNIDMNTGEKMARDAAIKRAKELGINLHNITR